MFYSLGIFLTMLVVDPSALSVRAVAGAFLPLLSDLWWYPSSYAAFLLLLPFLQPGLRALGERRHRVLCLVVIAVWGVASGLLPGIGLDTSPQSVLAFLGYFALVSYARWYGRVPSAHTAVAMLVSGAALSVFSVLAVELLAPLLPDGVAAKLLARETWMGQDEWMLPVALMSVGLFRLFLGMRFENRIVNWLASCSFAVYLVSQHPSVWPLLWRGAFSLAGVWEMPWVVPFMALSIAAVFLGCCLVDLCRQALFSMTFDRKPGAVFDRAWSVLHRISGRCGVE